MKLTHFFIERPIFAGVLSFLVFVAGLIAVFRLPISELPEVVPPTVVVTASYPGATAQTLSETIATPLEQEIVFASTGTKKPSDPPDKYVAALAGSDIQTNPPATNDAVEKLNKSYTRQVDKLPSQAILDDIDRNVDQDKLEQTLMQEGLEKFATPQKKLLKSIADKRAQLKK